MTVASVDGLLSTPPGASRRARIAGLLARPGLWVFAVSWSLVAVAVALAVGNGLSAVHESTLVLLLFVNAIVWAPVSGLLLDRRPNAVGILLASLALGSAVSVVATVHGHAAVLTGSSVSPGLVQAALDRVWIPVTLACFSILPFVLVERPLSRMIRGIVVVAMLASLVAFASSFGLTDYEVVAPTPFRLPDPGVVQTFAAAVCVTAVVAIIGALFLTRQWITRRPGGQRGLSWLTVGQWLLVVLFVPHLFGWVPDLGSQNDGPIPFALPIAQLFMPAAVLVAVLGRRVWGIDVALNRAVMSWLVIATLLATYVSITVALSIALPVDPIGAGAVAVAVLAVGVAPARRWIQRRVDALIYGEAANPAQLVASLGSRLTRAPRGENLAALVEALLVTLRLGYLAIESERPGGTRATAGTATGPLMTIDLRSSHGVIGTVSASALGEQRIDRRTQEILEQIAGVLSVALQYADVNREVAEIRERIVDARDEEQRMVRRELQKGIAPALHRNADELASMKTLLSEDELLARTALARLRTDLSARTNEVRDLARTLVPGALDNGDLEEALRELAARFSSPQLRITVDAPGVHELSAALQAATYHIVAEAVLLVRRAAGASEATIDIDLEDARRTVMRIEHDGTSLSGAGIAVLESLGDRVEELGGVLQVYPREPRGDRIVVEVNR